MIFKNHFEALEITSVFDIDQIFEHYDSIIASVHAVLKVFNGIRESKKM